MKNATMFYKIANKNSIPDNVCEFEIYIPAFGKNQAKLIKQFMEYSIADATDKVAMLKQGWDLTCLDAYKKVSNSKLAQPAEVTNDSN